jgi:tetratricopeptide (TPR) repeat protein
LTEFLLLQLGDSLDKSSSGYTRAQATKEGESLLNDRLGRLHWVLCKLAQHKTSRRIVIGFNDLSVLFDGSGRAKNAQSERLFRELTGSAAKSTPIDFILFSGERSLPTIFRRGAPEASSDADPLVELRCPGQPQRSANALDKRAESLRISPERKRSWWARLDGARAGSESYVHFIYPIRASVLTSRYFPKVASALAWTYCKKDAKEPSSQLLGGANAAIAAYELGLGSAAPVDKIERAKDGYQEALIKAILGNVDGDAASKLDQRFKNIFEACGERRYPFTMLMAAAEHRIGDSLTRQSIEACDEFLKEMWRKLKGLGVDRCAEVIVESVLDVYLGNGIAGTLSPEADLDHALLWQLAVIGQPASQKVLVNSVAVRDACAKGLNNGDAREDQVASAVNVALDRLESRCLVFPVLVRSPSAIPTDATPRYAVHRLMQRHVFTKMHARFVEYPQADEFALTLYLSQPNDVPRLRPDAFRALRRTVMTMVDYPESPGVEERLAGWSGDQTATRSQLLRAAFGMLRSVYAMTAIVRLGPPSLAMGLDGDLRSHGRGLLEEHRLLVRWIIRQAIAFDDEIKEINPGVETSDEYVVSRPFYAEEIAWLFNECAVLCLAQGRLDDSVALFDRAEEAAKRVEPHVDGALRTRIWLNRALAEIERGRLEVAESALLRIEAIADEHPVIRRIADGLLGLVDHLRGRFPAALKRYESALRGDKHASPGGSGGSGLIDLERSRAAALVAKFYSDLLRVMRDYENAEKQIRQSMTLAMEGGHEDVRHLVLLSELRLKVARSKAEGSARSFDASLIHSEIDVVEDYAKIMGMPRLQCEVDGLRALVHQANGDLKSAAAIASRGLALATTHGLSLRRIQLLLRLAGVYAARSEFSQCRPLLQAALEQARSIDYHSAFEFGQAMVARVAAAEKAFPGN